MLALMERSLGLLDRLHRVPILRRSAPATTAQRTGMDGERAAYFHLRRLGYIIVARRWRDPRIDGEVDLIAWEGETLCFIEVKTRDAATPFAAEFSVDASKQQALKRMAAAYIRHLPHPDNADAAIPHRFYIVSVYMKQPVYADIRVLRDLFR